MGIHTILTTAMLCFFFPLYGQEKKQSIMLDSVLVHGKQHNASLKSVSNEGLLWNMRMMNDMPKILGNADPMPRCCQACRPTTSSTEAYTCKGRKMSITS